MSLLSLVSPMRGLLVYSPFLVVLLPGLPKAWKTAPDWVRASALAGVVYHLVQLRLNGHDGGLSFFGYRLQLELLVLSWPLLVCSYKAWVASVRSRRIVVVIACLVSVAVFAYGTSVTHGDAMRNVELRERVAELREQPGADPDVAPSEHGP